MFQELFAEAGPPLAGVVVGWLLHEGSEWWRRRQKKGRFAKVLACEISAVRDRYMEIAGTELEQLPVGGYVQGSVDIRESYFTVFESNADSLGLLKAEDAKDVVSFYMTAKGHVDSLRTYKDLNEDLNTRVEEKVRYSARMKDDHKRLRAQVDCVLAILSKY